MPGTFWILYGVTIALVPEAANGLTCLTGTDVSIPRDNVYVQKCGAHEVCFLDEFATANGYIKFNIGCRDRQFCTSTTSGRRSATKTSGNITALQGQSKRAGNTKVCETCCDTPLCNSAGCGATGYPTRGNRGPICYACAQQRGPGLCDKITMCGSDSVCKLRIHPPTATGYIYYVSGCQNKQTCENDVSYTSSIVGRRRYAHEILTASKSCVVKCCDTDLCTGSCGTNSPVIVTSPTSSPVQVSNPCLSNPCAFGTCQSHVTSYTCQCQHGYSGATCNQHVIPGGCSVGWRQYGHSCYLIDKYKRSSWDIAKIVCGKYGAYLAEIDSDGEYNFLKQASTGSLGGDWWLGGNDKLQENTYVWTHSGRAVLVPPGRHYWGPGRPNNIVSKHSGEDEDCLEFQENIQAWNDEHCSANDHFICEKPV